MTCSRSSCGISKPTAWAHTLHQYLLRQLPKQTSVFMMSAFPKTKTLMANVCASNRLQCKIDVAFTSKQAIQEIHGLLPTSHDIRRDSASEALFFILTNSTLYQKLDSLAVCRCPQINRTIPAMYFPLSKRFLLGDHGSPFRFSYTHKYAALADHFSLTPLVSTVPPKTTTSYAMTAPIQNCEYGVHVIHSSKPFRDKRHKTLTRDRDQFTSTISPLHILCQPVDTHPVFLQDRDKRITCMRLSKIVYIMNMFPALPEKGRIQMDGLLL